MINKQLSANFSLQEMLRSQTATRKGYTEQFNPPDEVIENLQALCVFILQPLRIGLGCTISVSSGYRCERVNKDNNGAKHSQHIKGQASDISSNIGNKVIFNYILKHLPFDQLIWEFGDDEEPDWVHVSFNVKNNRKNVLVAKKVPNGKGKTKTIYETYKPKI